MSCATGHSRGVGYLRRRRICGCLHCSLQRSQGKTSSCHSALPSNDFASQIQDADVCTGLIEQQGPIIANTIRKASMTGQQGTKLCSALLGLCQDPPVNPYTVQFAKATPPPKIFSSSGKPPFQVAHFSDVHIDRQYTVS